MYKDGEVCSIFKGQGLSVIFHFGIVADFQNRGGDGEPLKEEFFNCSYVQAQLRVLTIWTFGVIAWSLFLFGGLQYTFPSVITMLIIDINAIKIYSSR